MGCDSSGYPMTALFMFFRSLRILMRDHRIAIKRPQRMLTEQRDVLTS